MELNLEKSYICIEVLRTDEIGFTHPHTYFLVNIYFVCHYIST